MANKIVAVLPVLDKFYAGCVVALNSGGPHMTIQEITEMSDGQYWVECVWFNENQQLESLSFRPASLRLV